MSARSITWFAIIFAVGFALVGVGHCGYGKLRWMQSLDAAAEHIRDKFDDVDHISTDTLAALLNADRSKVLLIDARNPDEYAISRIPGAINARDSAAVVAALKNADTPSTVIVYCSIGYRSAELAERLQKHDAISIPVKNVLGSIFQWSNEDRPLETPAGKPADKVHPFNKTWGRLLDEAKRANIDGAAEAVTEPDGENPKAGN